MKQVFRCCRFRSTRMGVISWNGSVWESKDQLFVQPGLFYVFSCSWCWTGWVARSAIFPYHSYLHLPPSLSLHPSRRAGWVRSWVLGGWLFTVGELGEVFFEDYCQFKLILSHLYDAVKHWWLKLLQVFAMLCLDFFVHFFQCFSQFRVEVVFDAVVRSDYGLLTCPLAIYRWWPTCCPARCAAQTSSVPARSSSPPSAGSD